MKYQFHPQKGIFPAVISILRNPLSPRQYLSRWQWFKESTLLFLITGLVPGMGLLVLNLITHQMPFIDGLALSLVPMLFLLFFGLPACYMDWFQKPQKTDRYLSTLFEPVCEAGSFEWLTLSQYAFIRNGYEFFVMCRKDGRPPVKLLSLGFFYTLQTGFPEEETRQDMMEYLKGKRIGSHIIFNYNILLIHLDYQTITTKDLKEILEEYDYLIRRFHLCPLTIQSYNELKQAYQPKIR